ncbi:hypothetical protein YC2023_000119 [Brassica napus]
MGRIVDKEKTRVGSRKKFPVQDDDVNCNFHMSLTRVHNLGLKHTQHIGLGMSTEGLSRGPGPFKPVAGRVWA